MRLIELLRADPAVHRLSTITIRKTRRATRVSLSYTSAGMRQFGCDVPPPSPLGLADEHLSLWPRDTSISEADVEGQIREVGTSGIIGGLRVSRDHEAIVIQSHCGTYTERWAWEAALRGVRDLARKVRELEEIDREVLLFNLDEGELN